MNHIELFAGCGGLSLGLESEGFELLTANELSPMAAETFALNHLKVDLENNGLKEEDKVFWISSQYESGNSERLREPPGDAAGIDGKECDLRNLTDPEKQLRRSLLVGSILDLNKLIKSDDKLAKALSNGLGGGGVDLVSGGPPCQSFSMAGKRQHLNERNSLPWAFAEFVNNVRPKIALLENVTGILRAFNVAGEPEYAWFNVAKAFANSDYIPICLHVNAKYVGAAQNRPRFIMIALEKKFAKRFMKSIDNSINHDALKEVLRESFSFFELAKSNENLKYDPKILKYYDVEDESNEAFFESDVFSSLVEHRKWKPKPVTERNSEEIEKKPRKRNLITVERAIDDLRKDGKRKSAYVKYINGDALSNQDRSKVKPENTEPRKNNQLVQARFRLYQLMDRVSLEAKKEIRHFLRTGDVTVINVSSLRELAEAGELLTVNGTINKNFGKRPTLEHLLPFKTKKQTQRALVKDQPAPAALSIPDDACHYHEDELRTLTVREMARIQSFPDWFEFRSKVTTGGQMRKYEVPQYTQVGNAVPPLLGKALGKVCKHILELSG